jgi:uncharacterized protein YjbJ (UPF0337 family)
LQRLDPPLALEIESSRSTIGPLPSRARAAAAIQQELEMGGSQMTNEKIEGQWDQAKGTVKENVGDAIDNEQMENEGKWDQAKGQVKEGVGNVKEGIDDAVDNVTDR